MLSITNELSIVQCLDGGRNKICSVESGDQTMLSTMTQELILPLREIDKCRGGARLATPRSASTTRGDGIAAHTHVISIVLEKHPRMLT